MSTAVVQDERSYSGFVIERALDATTVWGVVHLARHQVSGQTVVLKELAIPPLRVGLTERMSALQAAVEALRSAPPTISRALGTIEEPGRFIVVMQRAEGVPLDALKIPSKQRQDTDFALTAATDLTRGLRWLVQAGLPARALRPHHVMVRDDGHVTLVNLGLGQFLRPGNAWCEPTDSQHGVRLLGEMLYCLATGVEWSAGSVLAESDLPETLAPLISGCLLEGGFGSLEEVASALDLLHQVRQTPSEVAPPPEVRPPWQVLGWRVFLRDSLRLCWHQFRALRLRYQLLCAIVSVMALYLATTESARVVPYRKDGTVLYVRCRDGEVQAWDVQRQRRVGYLPSSARAVMSSVSTGRVYAAASLGDRLRAYDPRDHRLLASARLSITTFLGQDGATAVCLKSNHELSLVGLRSLRERASMPLTADAAVACDAALHRVLVAEGVKLRVLSDVDLHPLDEVELPFTACALRVDANAASIWVLPRSASETLAILDAKTLQLTRRQKSGGRGPIDVQFQGDRAFVLNQESGTVAIVSRTLDEVHGVVAVGKRPVAMQWVSDSGLWVAGQNRLMRLDMDTAQVATEFHMLFTPCGLSLVQ